MTNKKGFTILEIVIVVIFASLFFIIFFMQKANLDAMYRDETRKTAINAMYYALEKDFYPKNGYYPEYISKENISVIDPNLWTDPSGYQLGEPESSYSYQPANCSQGQCQEFILKANLEKEDSYIKTSQN
ncbi:type II secretion system protein [Candidatus Saccharibacteria bacterium]|nr:type II secretion system protein [Candidatus Saccharibacteria bacterium]